MDTLSIIILTAVINAFVTAAIGGIVLYRIQKKIDNSYFEHQTKFVRNHQKQVETLETLYQKFLIFADRFGNDMLESLDFALPSKKITKVEVNRFKSFQWQKHSDDLLECHNYFNNNRLFLSADMGSEINNILSNANLHLFILSLVLYRLKQDDMPAELIKSINDMITTKSDLGITKLSVKKPNLAMLMHQMVQQISQCKFTLENIYKSAAETPTKH